MGEKIIFLPGIVVAVIPYQVMTDKPVFTRWTKRERREVKKDLLIKLFLGIL